MNDKHPNTGRGKRRRVVVFVLALALLAGIVYLAWPEPPATTPAANVERFGLADDPIMGDPGSNVILVGFEAPGCSACRHFHLNVLPDLKKDLFDTGLAQYRFVQTTIGYDVDFPGGIAQECALKVGGSEAFWGFTDGLYQQQGRLHEGNLADALLDYASRSGYQAESMVRCYEDEETRGAVSADWDVARDIGVRGTPTFYIIPPDGAAYQVEPLMVAQAVRDAAR